MYKGRRTHSKIADQLSKGNQQKIQLMAALLADPEFIILDEPLSGLDSDTRASVMAVIARSVQGRTVIWVTHDLDVAGHLGAVSLRL